MSDDQIVYLIMEGEYEDRGVRWVTADLSVAQSIAAADPKFSVEEAPLIGATPIRTSRLWLSARLWRGALDESEHVATIWEFDGNTEPTIEQRGPSEHLEGSSVSWSFTLDVYGVNHEAVRELYEQRLGQLKEATAIPPLAPSARKTVELDRSRYARAAKLLNRPVQDLEFVRVGCDFPTLKPNLVAMVDGREVRTTITQKQADELTDAVR